MRSARVFEFVADELALRAGLGRAAARGAVRDALARALFAPDAVSATQMRMVVERLLGKELRRSGVAAPDSVCRQLVASLAAQSFEALGPESPDEIFGRLIRR